MPNTKLELATGLAICCAILYVYAYYLKFKNLEPSDYKKNHEIQFLNDKLTLLQGTLVSYAAVTVLISTTSLAVLVAIFNKQ